MKHLKSKSSRNYCTAGDIILTNDGLGCINCGAEDKTHQARSISADAHSASDEELEAAEDILNAQRESHMSDTWILLHTIL